MRRPRKHGVTRYTVEKILRRDGYMCGYCFGVATEVDHIVPFSHGGPNDKRNLIASCRTCNALAYDAVFNTLEEKRAYIQGQRAARKRDVSGPPKCVGCGMEYDPRQEGATIFLCQRCYERDCRV